jgi:FHA domain-containing protein
MDFAGKARKLERKITKAVDRAVTEFVGRTSGPAALEIIYSVLDHAEGEIQEIGRGRRLFPFHRVTVHVLTDPDDRYARARFSAVVDGPPSLAERLVDRMRAAGCAVTAIAVDVAFAAERGGNWKHPHFHVEFDRVETAAPAAVVGPEPPADVQSRIKLTIVTGSAAQRVYVFSGGRIDIGRRPEVLDHRQRLIRTNDIAFLDEGPEPNASVSRRHAHVEFSPQDRAYRVWDDGSAQGTSIIRDGRTVKVPAGIRGVRLESGDELVLGHARLKVAIEAKKN